MPGGRLDPADHLRRPWRVHALAAAEGLRLHDVWEVDGVLPAGVTLADWAEAFRRERKGRLTPALVAVRRALGRALRLDRDSRGFEPVYVALDEQLHRIENRTVTAFLHLSLADGRPRLAVYVRPRGRLGRAYMRLIDPVRARIVYPALLAAGRRAVDRLSPR